MYGRPCDIIASSCVRHIGRLLSVGYRGGVAEKSKRPSGMPLRLPPDVKEMLRLLAQDAERTMNRELIHLIREEWKRRHAGQPPQPERPHPSD